MNSISTLAGVISGLAMMALLFKPVFGTAAEFWECLRYWMTPDIFSWFNGEGIPRNMASVFEIPSDALSGSLTLEIPKKGFFSSGKELVKLR